MFGWCLGSRWGSGVLDKSTAVGESRLSDEYYEDYSLLMDVPRVRTRNSKPLKSGANCRLRWDQDRLVSGKICRKKWDDKNEGIGTKALKAPQAIVEPSSAWRHLTWKMLLIAGQRISKKKRLPHGRIALLRTPTMHTGMQRQWTTRRKGESVTLRCRALRIRQLYVKWKHYFEA
jgi:hypothetical protein